MGDADTLLLVDFKQMELNDHAQFVTAHYRLLYNPSERSAIDIHRLSLVPDNLVNRIEEILHGTAEEPPRKFGCTELSGDRYVPVLSAMRQLRDIKTSSDAAVHAAVTSLHDTLLISGLLPRPVEEGKRKAIAIDPSSLGGATRQRLETLVDGTNNIHMKADFFAKIGNKENVRRYAVAWLCQELQESDIPASLDMVLQQAREWGVEDAIQEPLTQRAQQIYEDKKGKNPHLALHLARKYKLPIPSAEMAARQEEIVYDEMTANWDHGAFEDRSFIDMIQETADGLPAERVRELATKAYKKLIGWEKFADPGRYLRAGQLAKAYDLGRDKILKAGERVIQAVEGNRGYGYSHVEEAFAELNLPEEMVHPVMVRLFEQTMVNGNDTKAHEIVQRHHLSDAEIDTAANMVYGLAMQSGWFEKALRLREHYPAVIQDQRASIEDLRTMVGILHYKPQTASQEKS
ncbi:hypothetical protein HYS48_00740 [Candidatus Woesearchaeota archaeon]|nr:hypothetical protein [Candidatus Woesearchaeota archaeon]